PDNVLVCYYMPRGCLYQTPPEIEQRVANGGTP
ncbi:unnamed protein product, partial [Tetraodon nigroviridis]